MPVKNAGLYLTECLNSILEQEEPLWELIAVDDHSTDDSVAILKHFEQQDNRIKVLQQEEVGIIPALQNAYKEASGNFIHRMDADDIMPTNKLSALKAALIESGPGTVCTAWVKYFAANGVSDGYFQYEQWLNQLCKENAHWKELYKECVIASPCWLLFRSDFERCGAFNSPIYPEDYDLVFRFFKAGLSVKSVPQVLHLWRDHSERTSRNHEHYQQNAFFEIKLHYFINLHYDPKRPLVIWGAGKKGKIMARLLQEKKVPFQWVSNNPNKNGKEIYNQLMASFESIATQNNPQIIITVAQRDAKSEIIRFLDGLSLKEGYDFFFFR